MRDVAKALDGNSRGEFETCDLVRALDQAINSLSWMDEKRVIIWYWWVPAHGALFSERNCLQEEGAKLADLFANSAVQKLEIKGFSINGGADQTFHKKNEI